MNDGYNTYKGHVVRLTSENMDLKSIFTTLTELWVQQKKLEEEVPFPYQFYYISNRFIDQKFSLNT